MKRTLLSLLLIGSITTGFGQAVIQLDAPRDVEDVTPESIGATQVSDNGAFAEEDQEMMQVVNDWMADNGDDTSMYYAVVDEENSTDDEILIKMYHDTAFPIMTSGAQKGITLAGNPGGKCKTIYYDPGSNEVIKQWWWD